MSYWQYGRYRDKQAYFTAVQQQAERGRHPLDAALETWDGQAHALISVDGIFDYEHEMALINRSFDNISGVKLVTPLSIEGTGKYVLVDRGFLPYDAYSSGDLAPYRPMGHQYLEGIIRPSQTKQFPLAPPAAVRIGEKRDRWLRLEVAAMEEALPYPVLPVFIEQTNQAGPYPLHDDREVLPAGRHLNYTLQWASFGTFAWVLALVLQYRRRSMGGQRA